MKSQIMLGILFTLMANRRATASELAAKFGCSRRSIYRYVDELTVSGIPIDLAQGPNGGIYISDCYKLPKGLLSRAEYDRTLDALLAFRDQLPDETVTSAIKKLTAQRKEERFDLALSGNILVDGGDWGSESRFSEKLALIEHAVEEREELDVRYIDRGGDESRRTIKPLLLVFKQNIWYLYAYCTLREDFRLFKIGRMRSIVRTGEHFEKIAFSRGSVPLTFWKNEKTLDARFEIAPEALPLVEEWLGVENIRRQDEKLIADVTLPDDDALAGKILSLGANVKVVYPQSLKERVRTAAEKLVAVYG